MEYKHLKLSLKKISDNGEFEGYAAVKGNVDAYGDIIEHNAFKRTLENQKSFPILWMHDPARPVGLSQHITEDKKGLFTRGKIDLSTELGKMVYSGLKNGYISEMSIGYKVIQDGMDAKGNRLLKEVKLLEYSLITKGFAANELAQVSGFKSDDIMLRLKKLESALLEKREDDMACTCGSNRRSNASKRPMKDIDEVVEDDMTDEEYEEMRARRKRRNNRNEDIEEDMGEEEMRSRRRRSKDSDEFDEPDSDEEVERRRRRRRREDDDKDLDLVEWAEEEEEEPEHRRSRKKPDKEDMRKKGDKDPAMDEYEPEDRLVELEDRIRDLMHRVSAMEGNDRMEENSSHDGYEEDEEWLSGKKPDKKMANSQTALSRKEWNSSYDTSFMQNKMVTGSTSLPLAPKEHPWDASAAKKRIFEWAGESDGKEFSPAKAKEAFFYCDPKNPRLKGSYKLPFADVISGKLHAVPRAISAVEGALSGARGGVNIPASDKSKIRTKANVYKKRMEGEAKGASSLINEMKDLIGGL